MKKKLILSAITLVSCLAILLGALVALPKVSHAATAQKKSPSSTNNATISVSPATLPNSQCNPIPGYENYTQYETCVVTITLNKAVPKGLKWTSSYSSKLCYISCSSDNSAFTIFQGSGTLYSSGGTQQALLIVPQYVAKGSLSATFVFSGPNNKATVKYSVANNEG